VTDQEIFDRETAYLGGRLDIENYPHVPAAPAYDHTREIAHELIKSAKGMFTSLPPIHFDFVKNGAVNALAFRAEERYFIGMTAGAMSMLHLILDRMLANPRTFQYIGRPAEEDPNLPPVPWDIPDAERLFHSGVRPILPKCPSRRLYALHLSDQALQFLIGHEIAHITRGHVDYLASSTGSPFLAELGWAGTPEERLERQAIETDADRRSVFARCHSALGTAYHAGDQFPSWATAPLTAEAWQFDWAFAVNTLFRLFGDARFSGVDLSMQPYPPLPLRRKMAMDTAMHLLIEAWSEERRPDVSRVLLSSVENTEAAFAAVGAGPSAGGLEDADAPTAREHISRINECWRGIRSKLKPFSFEQLGEV
jgi:hypothetical protein